MRPTSVKTTNYGSASQSIQPAGSPDFRHPFISETHPKIRIGTAKSGLCEFLWSDRTTRTAVLLGGFTLVAVGGSVGITYSVTHNVGATLGVLTGGAVLLGCVGNYIHRKADAMAYSAV
jgi:hypothetical protein